MFSQERLLRQRGHSVPWNASYATPFTEDDEGILFENIIHKSRYLFCKPPIWN